MFETGFCVQFHNIHRLVENSGEGRKRWSQSCQSGISPRRLPDLQLFSCEKKRGFHVPWLDALGTCLNLWLIWLICSIYQHHPTSIIYIHVPRATFLPYGSYGGLGEFFFFRPSQARKRTQTRGTEWTASQETLEKALQWDVAKWNHSPIGLDDKWHTFTSPCYVKPVRFSLPCARSLPASKCQQTKRTCDPVLSSLLRLLTVLTVLQ